MKTMIRQLVSKTIIILALMTFGISCEKDPNNNNNNNNNNNGEVPITGILEIEFRVPGSFLPPSRVLRADLSVAKNVENLYKGLFYHVENVYNSKLNYQITLAPGNYYYQAGIVCVAQGDSCSAAGFPGGQFGMKWAVGTANVRANETTKVVPQFTQ